MTESSPQHALLARAEALAEAGRRDWDVVIIGGGATGLGCAVDSASRGLSTLLLEAHDYGSGTSSRSTKLIHGGVRYLKSLQFGLVREALRERERLYENAPDLVHRTGLVVPVSGFLDRIYKSAGLRLYDLLAGNTGFGGARRLDRAQLEKAVPCLRRGVAAQGLQFFDGQFDDTRLLVALLNTFEDLGGVALNYTRVDSLEKHEGLITGLAAVDTESGLELRIKAGAVINATGVFSDEVRRLDFPASNPNLVFSRGTHIVLPKSFFPGDSGLVVPDTPDTRVLFILPWLDHVLVGTTEVPVDSPVADPVPTSEEIEYLLDLAGRYLAGPVSVSDVLSTFAGLRALPARGRPGSRTASLSRSHILETSGSGLITITGGKWTTYRRMAEHAVNRAAAVVGKDARSRTSSLKLKVRSDVGEGPASGRLHPALPYTLEDVRRAVWHEQARTVEDILCRRTRAAFLNAQAAIEMIDAVAGVAAAELGRDEAWTDAQRRFANRSLARFLPQPAG